MASLLGRGFSGYFVLKGSEDSDMFIDNNLLFLTLSPNQCCLMDTPTSTDKKLIPWPGGPQFADGRASPKTLQSELDVPVKDETDWSGMKGLSSPSPWSLAENIVATVHKLDSLESLILMLGSDAVIKEDGEYVSRSSLIVLGRVFMLRT